VICIIYSSKEKRQSSNVYRSNHLVSVKPAAIASILVAIAGISSLSFIICEGALINSDDLDKEPDWINPSNDRKTPYTDEEIDVL